MTRKLARAAAMPPVVLGMALLLGAGLAHPAAAQIDAVLQGFEPTGAYRLAVADKELPKAEIYQNQRAALIVMSSEFSSPLLIDVAGRQVSSLQLLKVYKRADGRVDLLADAVLKPVSQLQGEGAEGRFTLDGKPVVLKSSPFLLGDQRGTTLLDSNFGYRWRAKSYEPDAAALGRLRNEKRDVRVLTFFGSWCPHCAKHVPLLLKVEQRLADAKIRFDYHGLPTGFSSEPDAKSWKVDSVPTAIVFVGGKEVGRIPATQWENPEIALDLILHPAKATG